MGRDLYPALTALRVWGDKYLARPRGPGHGGPASRLRRASPHRADVPEGHVLQTEDLERRPGSGARMLAA